MPATKIVFNDARASVYFNSEKTYGRGSGVYTSSVLFFYVTLNLSKDQWRPLTGMMPLVENYITGLFHARRKPTVLRFQINTLTNTMDTAAG